MTNLQNTLEQNTSMRNTSIKKNTAMKNTPTPSGYRNVDISREPVELYKILKFENLVASGAEAKAAVASGLVLVNGIVETRKRKQIVAGDRIEFGTEKIFISLNSAPEASAPAPSAGIHARKKTVVSRDAIALTRGKRTPTNNKTSHDKTSHDKTSHDRTSHNKSSNKKTSHNKTSRSRTSHNRTSHNRTSHK